MIAKRTIAKKTGRLVVLRDSSGQHVSPLSEPALPKAPPEASPKAATPPKPRGFAAMDPVRRRALARAGGEKTRDLGKSFNSETARAACLKGAAIRRKASEALRKAEQAERDRRQPWLPGVSPAAEENTP